MPRFIDISGAAPIGAALDVRDAIDAAARGSVYYATDHGVVSDGTTNDLTALNALISTVSTAGGGVVLLPVGTTKVNGSVTMAANVTLRGHGWDSIIKLGATAGGLGVINIGPGDDNIVIENLQIDGNRAAFGSGDVSSGIWGLSGGGYENVLISNVLITGPSYNGITLLGSDARAEVTRNIRIVDCTTTDCGASGILVQGGVDQCFIDRCTVREFGRGIVGGVGITTGRYAYDVSITNCTIDGADNPHAQGHGISLDTVYSGVVCEGNTVKNCTGYGIEVGHVENGTVVGNTVIGGTRTAIALTGTLLAGTYDPSRTNIAITVASNVIEGTASDGISFIYNDSTSGQDCPASQAILRSTAYTAATTTRALDSRRLYECTTSGTTSSSKPAGFGTTATGDTVTDGTSVWTDRGSTTEQVTITGNVIRGIGGVGVYLDHCHRVNVTGNTIVGTGQSGILVQKNSNIFVLADNIVQGCNTTSTAGHGGVYIVVYTGAPHVAKVNNNYISNSGVANYLVYESTGSVRIDDRLQANSATSSVAFATLFRTANSVSTTITGLSDANAVDSRIITIHVNDANTTFQHSASGTNTLRLNGSTNYAAPTGTMVTFAWSQVYSQWFELSRSSF